MVIQRCSRASVSTEGHFAGMGLGLLVLAGVESGDNDDDVSYCAAKLVSMRVFSDTEGKMNLDATQAGADFMVISQFTLHAMTKKGNRPSFIRAAPPAQAIALLQKFVDEIEKISGKKVHQGKFGAHMQVELLNDGPVTIIIDSKNRE